MKLRTILVLTVLSFFACKQGENKESSTKTDSLSTQNKNVNEYTCPMHPQVITHSPGKCPECGMELQIKS